MPANPTTDTVAVIKNIVTTNYTAANVDNITLTIDDGGISGAWYDLRKITDLVRVYRGSATHKESKGIGANYATREDYVIIKVNTGGAAGLTPAGVNIRQHHIALQDEIERCVQANRINPDSQWDFAIPQAWTYTKEFPDEVESTLRVYIYRLWRPMET